MNRTRLLTLAALLAGAGCGSQEVPPPAGSAEGTPQSGTGSAGAGGAPSGGAGWFDAMWMQQMIVHHESAIEMAEACLAVDTTLPHQAQLVPLCSGIAEGQSAEIETMNAWLLEWYGSAEPSGGGMMGGGMMGDTDLSGLSGSELERAFLEGMIPHHQMAIHMTSACIQRAIHEDLAALCAEMQQTQSQEIEQMQGWLCEWFGVCGTSDGMGMGGMGTGKGGPGMGPMGPRR